MSMIVRCDFVGCPDSYVASDSGSDYYDPPIGWISGEGSDFCPAHTAAAAHHWKAIKAQMYAPPSGPKVVRTVVSGGLPGLGRRG